MAGLLVVMTSRLSRLGVIPRGVVMVPLYWAQSLVMDGIVVLAQTWPLLLSSDAVSGPANPAPALAKKDRWYVVPGVTGMPK